MNHIAFRYAEEKDAALILEFADGKSVPVPQDK